MRISTLSLQGVGGWRTLELETLSPGLNVVHGQPRSGKTTIADFLAHALYGQIRAAEYPVAAHTEPGGETIVESGGSRYRLRRFRDDAGHVRLTVSSVDGAPVDHQTVRRMLGGLSPVLLRRLYAISFRTPPRLEDLLSAEIAREFQSLCGVGQPSDAGRRTAELMARRDTLAKELETRLAGEGRASRDLDVRRRDLDRLIGETEREATSVEQRFRGVEAALTETDARLRYRRLELNVDRRWDAAEPEDLDAQLAEIDEQVARCREILAELASREATVRSRLTKVQTPASFAPQTVVDERTWLIVARQLAADLSGEVARLARASTSDHCVCRDAHPRLRPIVETLQRQLDVLCRLVDEQEAAQTSEELSKEIVHLARSQAELRQQLEFLTTRRQTLSRGPLSARSAIRSKPSDARDEAMGCLSAADAEQLEQRRHELEQERFDLVNRLNSLDRRLRDLRAQRTTVDRQRAALLSARSIEHVQRELALVEQKLEQSVLGSTTDGTLSLAWQNSPRASDFLAKLTDGRLTRLQLTEHGRSARIWTRDGQVLAIDSLTAAERDQVYLSLSLTLATAAERQAGPLPLLLDEPFLRLDAGGIAALAAVLDDLSRQGQQILVFTGQAEAVDRLVSLGATVQDVANLRQGRSYVAADPAPQIAQPIAVRPVTTKKAKLAPRSENGKKQPKRRRRESPTTDAAPNGNDHSDAA